MGFRIKDFDLCFMHWAGEDDKFSEWSEWSTCSATCGGGTQARRRTCEKSGPSDGDRDCFGPSEENRACNTQDCRKFPEHRADCVKRKPHSLILLKQFRMIYFEK